MGGRKGKRGAVAVYVMEIAKEEVAELLLPRAGESDIAQPRTNRMQTGKRAPEAVHSAKTGHRRLTLQRQPNRQP
ncbi:uncharacterized protein N7500_001788 [Penicillium coprophilum]|uniref:uncharacterized protein n=1 Tax=Penicillium coprophilum TaxID=36646 RepID=UPI0023922A62|nr:uncharacterized protein N7500_001788 [Penicillium coprophilum]KAJ5173857.1 hypothetical protein N7500_001788 [Penicillium coprophilum]